LTEEPIERADIVDGLERISEHLERISAAVDDEICRTITGECESDWVTSREVIASEFASMIPLFRLTFRLPANETGLVALDAMSTLLKIEGAYHRIVLMVDMIRDVDFESIYMDSLGSISKKVRESVFALKNMALEYRENPEVFSQGRETISQLEREVDEENIIICRQISVATGGHSDFVCYVMRQIVGELERITDHIEDLVEILEGL